MIEMTVTGIGVESDSGATVLVLEGDGQTLAMVIGLAEATSIAKALDQIELPRPLAHDLLRDLLGATGAQLRQVEVVDLREGTYYADLVIRDSSDGLLRLDCRPSDAIAVALRVGAPILVHEHVLAEERPEPQEFPSPADKEGWKKVLEEMKPEDFGKYKM